MVNKDKIIEGVKLILEGIGEDVNREGLVETPNRIARMYEEIFSGLQEDVSVHLKKRFHVEDNQMIMEKDIPFYSMCEHHLLPFFGKVHIAYVPNGKVVGLSKLARTVEVYAKRPQIQEQMTSQIADAIMEHLEPLRLLCDRIQRSQLRVYSVVPQAPRPDPPLLRAGGRKLEPGRICVFPETQAGSQAV